MKLKLKETPEQEELVRALGSRNPAVSQEANEAFAAFIGPKTLLAGFRHPMRWFRSKS